MSSNLYLNAAFVKAEIGKILAAYPELAEDETLRADTFAGETHIERVVEMALSECREAQMMVSAIKEREVALSDRRQRYERKDAAMKKLIVNVLRAGNLDRIALPEASVFLTKPRASVGISDLNDLPQGFFKTERKADKAAIREALEVGQEVPGAFWVLGDVGLTVRTK